MTFLVTFYTRKNCKLCDQAKTDLDAIQADIPHDLVVVDIDQDPDLQAIYRHRVPVIQAGPFTLEPPFDQKKLRMTLGAARDNQSQRLEFEGIQYERKEQRRQTYSRGDRISHFLSKHFMVLINLFLALYVGLPFLGPVLMKTGHPELAKPIYTIYGATCHKLAFRSWFLFGEQTYYPREAANIEGLVTYGDATGFNEDDLFTARSFNGNEELGYKVPFCQRDVAIWGAMLLFGLLFAFSKRRIPPLPWYLWFLIGIAPIGLDGFSQLLSQLGGFTLWAYRESTPFLRTLTGGLFGLTTAWFGFPVIEETMEETRQILAAKRARALGRQENKAD